MKILSYHYTDFHYESETVSWLYYLYNGCPIPEKTTFILSWGPGRISGYIFLAWWRHQMETFSPLLAICAGNSPVPGEFPHKTSDAELWCFLWSASKINDWVNNHKAGDLRCYRTHYDVIVMGHLDLYQHDEYNHQAKKLWKRDIFILKSTQCLSIACQC